MDWFRAGGFSMWFLVVFGALALLSAARFARRPSPELLARIACLERAVSWAVLTGVASDLAAVGHKIATTSEWAHSPDLPLIVLTGFSESLMPAVLGGGILSVGALLTAVGHARMHAHGVAP